MGVTDIIRELARHMNEAAELLEQLAAEEEVEVTIDAESVKQAVAKAIRGNRVELR